MLEESRFCGKFTEEGFIKEYSTRSEHFLIMIMTAFLGNSPPTILKNRCQNVVILFVEHFAAIRRYKPQHRGRQRKISSTNGNVIDDEEIISNNSSVLRIFEKEKQRDSENS